MDGFALNETAYHSTASDSGKTNRLGHSLRRPMAPLTLSTYRFRLRFLATLRDACLLWIGRHDEDNPSANKEHRDWNIQTGQSELRRTLRPLMFSDIADTLFEHLLRRPCIQVAPL